MAAVSAAENAAREVKEAGRQAGFDLVRIAPARPFTLERERHVVWIADGRAAEMRWMTAERAERASDPEMVLPGARSLIAVGLAYRGGERPAGRAPTGKIARYAWGRDYHAVMGEMLSRLAADLQGKFGGSHRWYVDTGPIMDRAVAARAGLGWVGKNTNVLTERFGSYVLLGEILTTLELSVDRPVSRGCGSCRLCLVACPTGALGPEYNLDSRKCISYLTIEHRGPIPRNLRAKMGDWVFGCDVCQDVCPPSADPYFRGEEDRKEWARSVRAAVTSYGIRREQRAAPEAVPGHRLLNVQPRAEVDLIWLLRLSHAEYVEAFRGSSIRRAKVWMLRRNAAVALGNVGDERAIEPVRRAMLEDEHPVVRSHAAWALWRIGTRFGVDVSGWLRAALETEADADVVQELRAYLSS